MNAREKYLIVYDEAHGFWTGRPWLVIEGGREDPADASFASDIEAFAYADEQRLDAADEVTVRV